MDITSLLIFLAIGAVAGWLAGILMKGGGFGLLMDIVLGIVGAVVVGKFLLVLIVGLALRFPPAVAALAGGEPPQPHGAQHERGRAERVGARMDGVDVPAGRRMLDGRQADVLASHRLYRDHPGCLSAAHVLAGSIR